MNAILFSLLKPKDPKDQEWRVAKHNAEEVLKPHKEIQELGEGSWLIQGAKNLPFVGRMVASAEADNYSYKIIVIQDGIEWDRIF